MIRKQENAYKNNQQPTNIQTPHSGAFEYWLGLSCNLQAELLEIGQKILDFKNTFII